MNVYKNRSITEIYVVSLTYLIKYNDNDNDGDYSYDYNHAFICPTWRLGGSVVSASDLGSEG